MCVLFYTDPLAARTFRKDGVAQIDKAWGANPGAAAAPEAPVPSKRSRSRSRSHSRSHSRSDKHKHHKHKHHHHHHREKESTKGAQQQQQQQQPARKSLLEEHLERVQSGAAPAKRARGDAQQSLTWRIPGSSSNSTGGTAYWDRERDMEAMHVSRQTVTDLLGRADALGARFRSGGSSTRFV